MAALAVAAAAASDMGWHWGGGCRGRPPPPTARPPDPPPRRCRPMPEGVNWYCRTRRCCDWWRGWEATPPSHPTSSATLWPDGDPQRHPVVGWSSTRNVLAVLRWKLSRSVLVHDADSDQTCWYLSRRHRWCRRRRKILRRVPTVPPGTRPGETTRTGCWTARLPVLPPMRRFAVQGRCPTAESPDAPTGWVPSDASSETSHQQRQQPKLTTTDVLVACHW